MARIKIERVLDEDWLAVEFSETGIVGAPAKRGYVLIQDFCDVYGMSPHSKIEWLVGEDRSGFPRDRIKERAITKRIVNPERDAPVGYGDAW
jgi:hypothetical protein